MAMKSNPVPTVATGGCIRFTNDGPQVHHNDTHTSSGIREVSINDQGRIEILHTSPGPIITMSANADETLVSRGIAFGCSGGVGRTLLIAAANGKRLDLSQDDHYALLRGTAANVWVHWLHHAA